MRPRPSTIRASRSGWTFASRWIVAATYAARLELVPAQHGRALARDRREAEARVGHHVADDVDPPGDALGEQRLARALVGAEEELRRSVDRDPVVLLRHREVAAAEPRLDMRDGDAGVARRLCSRERRVRVAEDERPVGPLLRDRGSRSPAASSRRRRCAGRAGSAAPAARAPRRRRRRGPDPSVARCGGRPPRSRRRAARRRRGPDLMNCGRLPTTVRTFTEARLQWPAVRAVSSAGRAGDS